MYTIVEGIPNTGSYVWTPSTTLEDDTTHYGIQLIEDSNGFYQYTDQFGVANKGAVAPTSRVEKVVSMSTSSTPAVKTPEPTYPAKTTEDKDIPYATHYATLTSCD